MLMIKIFFCVMVARFIYENASAFCNFINAFSNFLCIVFLFDASLETARIIILLRWEEKHLIMIEEIHVEFYLKKMYAMLPVFLCIGIYFKYIRKWTTFCTLILTSFSTSLF